MRRAVYSFAGRILPALLWPWLFVQLHDEWTLNAQYNYGWAVPFLAVMMFHLRWRSRPAAAWPAHWCLPCIAWGLLALLLPIRLVEQANPDWRLLSWALALVVVAFSLLTLLRWGGWSWVAHFAFPVCFTLVSVAWPVQFENLVVQGMTRAVAFVAVEIAGWIGVGAYQIGNIIELHNGFVGVDEACSGVKTLQAAIMVSLVLGEFLQLRIAKRFALVFGGCAWVFGCNVIRATTLVIIAAQHGTQALADWHDTVGLVLLILGMAGLVAIAWLMRERADAVATVPTRAASQVAGQAGLRSPLVSPLLGLAWLVAIFAGTEFWYRSHERELVRAPAWRVHWPANNDTMRVVPIAETTRAILRYDVASSAAWQMPAGVQWWSFFARWNPQRTALQLVHSHSPEICLPAAGRTFVQELPPVVVETEGLPLAFRAFEFEQSRRPLFVYVCIQEDRIVPSTAAAASRRFSARSRVRAVLHGQRNLGQRLLELAVTGVSDADAAREALTRIVRSVVELPRAVTKG